MLHKLLEAQRNIVVLSFERREALAYLLTAFFLLASGEVMYYWHYNYGDDYGNCLYQQLWRILCLKSAVQAQFVCA